jgi:hypothetical protein
VPDCRAARTLAEKAVASGVEFPIAVSATVERSLARLDLSDAGLRVVAALDERARGARAQREIAGALSVYLRQIAGGARVERGRVGEPIPLPARVTGRLAVTNASDPALLLEGELDQALAWERAAVLSGRTISEWALAQALLRSS